MNIKEDELLQREQLKSILGGGRQECKVGDNTCTKPEYCIVDSYASYPNGHCGIVTLTES